AAIVTANAQAALTAAGLVVAVDAAAVVVANDAVILEAANLAAVTLAEAPAAAAAAAAVIAATGLLGNANTAALTANATATASAAAVVTATTNAANAAAAALAADAALVAAANTANNDAAAATVANNAVVTAQAALDAAIVVGDLAAIDAATIALTNATNAANAANTTAAASADVVVTATADAANAAMATAAADALLVTATNDAGVDAAAATAANDAVVVATDNLAIANDAVAASAAVVAAAQATLDAATLVLDAATATAAASSANAAAAAVAVEAAAANVAAIADSPEQGLLAKVGFENHYTTMLQSAMFKDMELGGSTVTTLLGGGTIGDGGVAGTDTAKFAGNKADYTITSFQYVTANQGEITVYKIVDNVGPLGTRLDVNGAIVDDGTDVLVGVEFAQFADQTTTLAPIAPANDAPVITSDAGAAIVAKTMAEETTAVATITATDANGDALTYSISGGADAAMFTINAAGELSFITAPSFEAPTDIGANRVYDVMVKVSDGTAHDFQSIAVTVTNVDEAATGSMGISGASMNALGTIGTINGFNTMVDPDGTSNFLKYQWQKQVGATWVNIAGAAGKSANLVTTAAGVAGALNAPNVLHLASAYTDPFGNKTFVSDQTVYVGSNSTTAETFSASGGNDVVLGLSGNDTITAGAGNDQVDGGAGNDIFMATLNDGDDAYVGGLGIDTYNLSGTSAAADVNLTAGTASSLQTGTDTLSGIENVTGSSGNNVITDSNVANNLVGGAGNDTFVMLGDNFRDVITGGTNVDTVNYSSTTANLNVNLTAATAVVNGTGTTAALSDTVNGVENFVSGSGNDIIIGSSVANALNGGDGADTLTGGAGKDTLTGGAGADVFDYNLTTETGNNATLRDVITDFVQGADIIDLSGIDANTGVVGNDAFIFNLTPFFNGPGEITVFYQNVGAVEHTVIEGNVNAALSTDFQIALVGHHNLTAADFVL
ncbi:MAG: calcium-binding protein, partial [Gallionella sp.]|nr:calcium-binding protein [Gallionella sp.]